MSHKTSQNAVMSSSSRHYCYLKHKPFKALLH